MEIKNEGTTDDIYLDLSDNDLEISEFIEKELSEEKKKENEGGEFAKKILSASIKSKNVEDIANITQSIKKLIFNYDLNVIYAKSKIEFYSLKADSIEGAKSSKKQSDYIFYRFQQERYATLLNQLVEKKKILIDNIDLILAQYQPLYREIFSLYFLQDKTIKEISAITDYSEDSVMRTVNKLKEDLIDFA